MKFGYLLMTVVQAILLFGSEMWVVTPHIGKKPGGFPPSVLQADHREETSAVDISGTSSGVEEERGIEGRVDQGLTGEGQRSKAGCMGETRIDERGRERGCQRRHKAGTR